MRRRALQGWARHHKTPSNTTAAAGRVDDTRRPLRVRSGASPPSPHNEAHTPHLFAQEASLLLAMQLTSVGAPELLRDATAHLSSAQLVALFLASVPRLEQPEKAPNHNYLAAREGVTV